MKHTLLLVVSLFVICIANAQTKDYLQGHGKEIQAVIKNEKGVIRGYDFGVSAETVRKTEDAQFIADGKNFMIFKKEIDKNEYAEIIYYLDEQQKVKGFGIAFIENVNLSFEESLIDDFQKYFNERYGKFITNDKNDEMWTSKEGGYVVEMGDSSEGGDLMEIEIEIYKK
ncbi:MAG: hypothetical protein J7604_23020 [Sporocytophaga sp.]|uniref:hypothetical protein n=1 Tax=Sporocytophaga sp. TaxID=2231183 RepID=UPI001B124B33|nr:hypothetical protein [Sporocytophaga sp.]MBO9703104.1 hypothetical protein [Sporocytophaga sp.]